MSKVISSFHLSDVQRELLAKIKAAPNPHVAFAVTTTVGDAMDSNFAQARDTLAQLGVLSVTDGNIEIVNDQVLKDEGIVDDMGELTPEGQQLAFANTEQPQQAPAEAPAEETGDDLSLEGISLFREIDSNAKLMEQIASFNKKKM